MSVGLELREFDAVRETSQLPDWLDESELSQYWLLDMAGTHGNEPWPVEYMQPYLAEPQRPGVLPIVANSEAVAKGVRFLGNEQLMACYPGSFDMRAPHEDRVAAGVVWLVSKLRDPKLIIDRHTNESGYWFAGYGGVTTPAAMAVGHIMGYELSTVAPWAPFYKVLQRSISTEDKAPHTPEEKQAAASKADAAMDRIVTLGHAGLTALYFDERPDKSQRFYHVVREVNVADPRTGEPNEEVLSVLQELEEIECPADYGAEIQLSRRVRDALGLSPVRRYMRGTAHYNNISPVIDNASLGLPDDGVVRRLGWGDLLEECAPPELVSFKGEDLLVFDLPSEN